MSSEQIRRENITKEREIDVPKDRVPKITSHFESIVKPKDEREGHLADKLKNAEPRTAAVPYSFGAGAGAGMEEEDRNKNKNIQERKETQTSAFLPEDQSSSPIDSKQAQNTAKESVLSATQKAKEYTAPVADLTKKATEVTVEGTKGAAGFVGKVGMAVKDAAVVGGWEAAHFTVEKTVEGTKAVAGAVEGVAGYTSNKAVDIGSKSLGFAKNKAAAVADTLVDYTARKKQEAEEDYKLKKTQQQQTQTPTQETETRQAKEKSEPLGYTFTKGGGQEGQEHVQGGEGGEHEHEHEPAGGGGIFEAISETVGEIAQATKDMVVGPKQTREEHKK